MRDLVGYESWLERDRAMLMDFSPEVVTFSSQPFWLTWPAGRKRRRHAPDYFARLAATTLRQRELAKVEELRAAGHSVALRTFQRMRRNYEGKSGGGNPQLVAYTVP